jgi:hypothetical protein
MNAKGQDRFIVGENSGHGGYANISKCMVEGQASFLLLSRNSFWTKSASYECKNKSANKGAQLVPKECQRLVGRPGLQRLHRYCACERIKSYHHQSLNWMNALSFLLKVITIENVVVYSLVAFAASIYDLVFYYDDWSSISQVLQCITVCNISEKLFLRTKIEDVM